MQYFNRWLEAQLASHVSKGRIRLLFGARQTGKSTLFAKQAPERHIFIDLQDSDRRRELEQRPKSFSDLLLAKNRKSQTVIIDEIQKVPALLDEIQWLYDKHPGRFEFFVTGSSARKLRSSSSNLLPGRTHLYHLFPVLQAERGVKTQILPFPIDKRKEDFPKRKLKDLLLFGSLPGLQNEKSVTAAKTLQGYSELYLEEEIRKEGLVRDVGAFSRFLELAAMESGKTVNLTKLSNQSGVPISTLKSYYQILVDTFVGYWLEPFSKPGRKRILSTPKFFIFDLGVRNAAARLEFSEALLRLQGGELLEQWVGLELLHRSRYLGAGHRLGFWRTVGGAEVDFVVETPKEVVPIEVKWTDKPTQTDASHLHYFMDDVPAAKKGYVICRVKERRRLTAKVEAIPWDEM